MESTFFSNKVHSAVSNNNLRTSIIEFIVESCHFLETLYDPFFRWRAYLCGKDSGSLEVEQSPVSVHPETIPFLYESFETALVDCFPELAHEMLTVFGAVISGRDIKGISELTLIQLIWPYKITWIRGSSEIPYLSLCLGLKRFLFELSGSLNYL